MTTRRTFLTGTAAATAAAALPAVALASNPDATFLIAYAKYERLKIAADDLLEAGKKDGRTLTRAFDDVMGDAYDRVDEAMRRVADVPAHTIQGVSAKLRILNKYAEDQCIERCQIMAASVLADVERMTA